MKAQCFQQIEKNLSHLKGKGSEEVGKEGEGHLPAVKIEKVEGRSTKDHVEQEVDRENHTAYQFTDSCSSDSKQQHT